MVRIGGGVFLVIFAAIAAGSANQKVETIGTPDPMSNAQAIVRQEQPGKPWQVGGAAIAFVTGLGLLGSAAWDLMNANDKEAEQAMLLLQAQQAQRKPLPVPMPQQSVQEELQIASVPVLPPSSAPVPNSPQTQIQPSSESQPMNETVLPPPPVQPPVPPPAQPIEIPDPENVPGAFYQQQEIYLPPTEPVIWATPVAAEDQFYKAHEQDRYATVRSLVDEGNVGIIGSQKGSGKTSKQSWLIGEHIKQKHLVWKVDPFCAGYQFKGIKVWGRGFNYNDAAQGIRQWTNLAKQRMQRRGDETCRYDPFEDYHLHLAIDELSNYGRNIDQIDASIMPDFWEVTIQFIRQMNMSCSFCSHGDTQALLGGEKALKGKSETIRQGITWLYCYAQTDTSVKGNKRCAGYADYVRFESGNRIAERIDVPSWMQGPNPDNDFTEMVKEHCPQYLYVPGSTKTPVIGQTPEEFRKKLTDMEKDLWEDN
ncbi:hypothetical protein [Scytonema hofmannii]|nr:hypothetical protein [Scytonema hofmannii]